MGGQKPSSVVVGLRPSFDPGFTGTSRSLDLQILMGSLRSQDLLKCAEAGWYWICYKPMCTTACLEPGTTETAQCHESLHW